MSKNNTYYIAGGALLVLAVLISVWRFNSHEQSQQAVHNTTTTAAPMRGLDGTMVAAEIAKRRPIAVVIDNQTSARPQSGLADADIVYETLAEGGITRYLTLFQTKQVDTVGPIRSARIYFNQLAEEWGAIYAHVGGNSDALEALKTSNYSQLANADQFLYDSYFDRITTRPAPHNVYTSTTRLYELAQNQGWNKRKIATPTWQFAATPLTSNTAATSVRIPFSTPEYGVSYTYAPKEQNYLRTVGAAAKPEVYAHPTNILIQFVETTPTKTDTAGSISLNLDKGGKAVILTQGRVSYGTWQKNDGRTYFRTETGGVATLSPGQTWIEIVPRERANKLLIK